MDEASLAAQLRNLEIRLRTSLDNAWQASADFDRVRAWAGLGPFLPTEHRIALGEVRLYAAETYRQESSKPNAAQTAQMIIDAGRVRRGEVVSMQEAEAQRLRLVLKDKR
jgi:hypothetical protein